MVEQTIEINVNSKQAEANLKAINSTINEQRDILVLLEEEYLKAKKALDDYNASGKINLGQEKALKSQLKERKDALTDQRLGLKKLAVEQRAANEAVDSFRVAQKDQTNVIRGIDKLTGGYATKIVKLKKGFLSGVKGVKSFALGLKGLRGALISTGIGALVVLLGTIIAYWDDITAAISGVSKEQSKLLADQEDSVAASEAIMNATKESENTLRLQGKSEKEIADLKKQQLNDTIANLEAMLLTQESIKKTQVEAAERNQNIAKGIIAFLSLPLMVLTGIIDGITNSLASVGVISEGTTLSEDFLESTSSMIFDPKEVAEKGDETIEETKNQLRKLKNTRDGIILKERNDRDKENKKELADLKKQNEEKLKLEKEYQDRLKDLKSRIRDAVANTEAEDRALQIEKMREDHAALMAEALANGLLSQELIQSLKEREDELKQGFKDADDEAAEEAKEKEKQTKEEADQEEADRIAAQEEYKENEYRKGYSDLQNIVSLGGKKLAKVGKALAIADVARTSFKSISETISSTGIANAKAVSASPLTGGMPWVAINTAKAALSVGSTVASAAKSIQAIKGDKKSVSGGGSSVGGGGGGSAPAPPTFNVVGGTPTSQLADAVASQTQQPIQTYVVANDVTSAQSLENNIIEGATL